MSHSAAQPAPQSETTPHSETTPQSETAPRLETAPPPETPPSPAAAERLAAANPDELGALQDELAAAARQRFRRLAAAGSWTPADVEALVELLLVDHARALGRPGFLERALPVARAGVPLDALADADDELLGEVLVRLTRPPGLPLAALEELESVWGTIARRSLESRLPPPAASLGSADAAVTGWHEVRAQPAEGEIQLSVYSLASHLFDRAAVEDFLRALRRQAPRRSIVVLADRPRQQQLAPLAADLGIHLSRTWGRTYSPWPRDAMSFLQLPEGGRLAVLRPNRQPGRENDSFMALELIQDLPPTHYQRLGPLSWAVAPIPFHNGNVLRTAERGWISIHSLEPRILELLGVDRVPVESFASAVGVEAYIAAARRAASEMEPVFGVSFELVHPLPEGREPAELAAAMGRLGGGAGIDLDSALTLLDGGSDGVGALVGDLAAGARLIAAAPAADIEELGRTYGLAGAPEPLRAAIVAAQDQPVATGLAGFLDLIAGHLGERGITVRRLPLLRLPSSLLAPGEISDPAFLVGWNNVVLERRGGRRRAEGFASGLASGDDLARRVFAELGYELELLPPLVASVLRNGGYRCASNHLR